MDAIEQHMPHFMNVDPELRVKSLTSLIRDAPNGAMSRKLLEYMEEYRVPMTSSKQLALVAILHSPKFETIIQEMQEQQIPLDSSLINTIITRYISTGDLGEGILTEFSVARSRMAQ